nr:hypothetical protein [Oscillospiraceae bacterium]
QLTADSPAPIAAQTDGGEGEDAGEEEERLDPGLRERFRQRLLALPLALRLLVVLPLWALGSLLITVFSPLFQAFLGPVLGKALAWLALLAALAGAFLLAAKAVFPDLPLKKLLNRRSLLILLGGALLGGLLDCFAPFLWDGYESAARLARWIAVGLILGAATLSFALRENRKRREAAAEAEETHRRAPLSRREILALADEAGRACKGRDGT